MGIIHAIIYVCVDRLLAKGKKYMFVSNSDNLGATVDLDLLTYFAKEDVPFMMEVCERTENDKKGGHLALRNSDGRLILRESAQCSKEDEAEFQNINKYKYFNTNNLWLRLDTLKQELNKRGGFIDLPMIKNGKTVDPQQASSTAVFQLETAMGAAIECFEGSKAVVVPRTRFAPVKKCDDLFMLRSDAYVIGDDERPKLAPGRTAAPIVSLDGKFFKLVQDLEANLSGGVPSLVGCDRLKVNGHVVFADGVVFQGNVTVTNPTAEPKVLPAGTYSDTEVNLATAASGYCLGTVMPTAPIAGQKPGTSGLRKKTKMFMGGNYLNNFVQACFDALVASEVPVAGGTLVMSGDGRYFNKEAIQIMIKMAVANGVGEIWVGTGGLLSTPAVSAVIRNRGSGFIPFGGFILSASHNPGGPDEDWGIKYNCENGGPAPEGVTDKISQFTESIGSYKIAKAFPEIDMDAPGVHIVQGVKVCVFDCTEDHTAVLKQQFDFASITRLIQRPDFSFVYDSMNGVNGPYSKRIFVDELGADASCLQNAESMEDFGGPSSAHHGHADPNLTHAVDLVRVMGLTKEGTKLAGVTAASVPSFGAAADGDADRNMILGNQFFVSPSDSVAIISANAQHLPGIAARGGLKACARSMPTSCALDRVAAKRGIPMFETPTGWKFFGNLMDSGTAAFPDGETFTPFICGEESFGTGSDHVREKDGMWAVLAWMQILAARNPDAAAPLVTVEQITSEHWSEFGRNYYARYDYEGVEKEGATALMAHLTAAVGTLAGTTLGEGLVVEEADMFAYTDPVDGSVSKNQGIRVMFHGGSRICFRLSGTGVAGATIRLYLEKYVGPEGSLLDHAFDVVEPLAAVALALSKLTEFTGRTSPTVIT